MHIQNADYAALQDCFSAVAKGDADWAVADPLIIYLLDQEYGNTPNAIAPFAMEVRGDALRRSRGTGSGEGAGYYSVALVRSSTCRKSGGRFTLADAKGSRSCHTRYGDLAGWAFPVYQLEKQKLSQGADDLTVVSEFFSASCAPSNGDLELCSACSVKEQCNLSERYSGDMGVIQALQEDVCDIGFVDHYAALATLVYDDSSMSSPPHSDFSLVCNGGCQPVNDDERVCSGAFGVALSARPWDEPLERQVTHVHEGRTGRHCASLDSRVRVTLGR